MTIIIIMVTMLVTYLVLAYLFWKSIESLESEIKQKLINRVKFNSRKQLTKKQIIDYINNIHI